MSIIFIAPAIISIAYNFVVITNVWKGPPFRWYLSLFKAVLPTIHYYILYRTSIFDCCFRQKEA